MAEPRGLSRREALGGLAAGLVGLAAGRGEARFRVDRRPNIIFILADDLGYGDLGCYGQQTIATPNLDAMARGGMRFVNTYAGSTVCAPSRCCLMTGLHTGHARVRGNALVPLAPDDTTVAEVLRDAGYATGLVGKWGLGEPETTGIPNRQGFDFFYGYLNQVHAHNYYPDYLWRNEVKEPLPGNADGARGTHTHALFTAEAEQFIRRHDAEPFFLYLAYTVPHANNERGRETGDGMEVPSHGPYAGRPWPEPVKGHAAMIHDLDRDVGRLLRLLDRLGLADNTLVIFSSDNGPHREGGADPDFFNSNGPLRGIKRDLYEGGIRVPGIAWWPGRIAPGQVSYQPWAFWDFLPTAAELAGTAAPAGIDGLSMVPTLLGGAEQPQHDYLYWEFHERGFSQAVRQGAWKAVRRNATAGPVELYHLVDDPGEQRDVAAEYAAIAAGCERAMAAARTDDPRWAPKLRK